MKKQELIWMNGTLLPGSRVNIPFLTHGLHYGSAVFEGIRVYNGQIYQLEEHIERLFVSCVLMDMKIPFTKENMMHACKQVVEVQGLMDGYIRPLVWRGGNTVKICAPDIKIETAIAAWYVPSSLLSLEEFLNRQPITLTISRWKRPSPESAPIAAKASGLYVIATLAAHEARAAGFADALMLDYRGYLAEASSSNLFIIIDGKLHTPLADCFLDGITRQTVMKLSKIEDIPVIERHIFPEELHKAQEVFLTGTACEILPVSSIDNKKYQIGSITKTIMKKFYYLVQNQTKIS